MNISRTALAFALVPILGALALGPGVAFADQGGSKMGRQGSERQERMHDDQKGHHMRTGTTTKDGIRGLFDGNGGRHHSIGKSEAARVWNTTINASIQNAQYSNFTRAASNTPLGNATTENIFNKLVDASNLKDGGKYTEARSIMKSLRDSGYHFKKLIRESLKVLFLKNT